MNSRVPPSNFLVGLRTVIYTAPDLEKVKAWYSEMLGVGPYFDEPFYVGFNVGGYELGLDPFAPPVAAESPVGPVAYWGVADVEAGIRKLITLGATVVSGPQDVGGDIVVATIRDPFGNVFGIIRNPHFGLPAD